MVISRLAVLALAGAMLASGAAAESIKVATWNMNNLHTRLASHCVIVRPPGRWRTTSSSESTVTGWAPTSSRYRR
jgi:hypothetical protein